MEFGSLWEILAVLVFLLAPVWRSVIETRRRAVEEQRKRAAAPAPPATVASEQAAAEEAATDLDPWEALLRGLEPPREQATAEPEPEALPEPAVAQPDPTEPEPLVAFPGSASAALPDADPEELGALADELEHREEFHSSLEDRHEIGAGLSSLTPSFTHALAYEDAGPAHNRVSAVLPGQGQSSDWRTAIVLAEILGPPIALRPGGYREPH